LNSFEVLTVTAIAQAVFLAALLLFLVYRRRRTRVRGVLVEKLRQEAQRQMRAWVAGGAPMGPFVAVMASMPSDAALEFASEMTGSVLDVQSREALSGARQWWKRREAARAFALVGTPDDRALVKALLDDRHTAVGIIAIGAVPRVADEALISWTLDRYPFVSNVARRLLHEGYTHARAFVEPALVAHLREDAAPGSLARWITVGADLQLTSALERIATLDSHPDAGVRRAVARALAKRPHPDSMAALRALISDTSPEVRASAAWAMGQINSVAVLPHLKRAVHDSAWVVRYQSALALATLGEKGRAVLGEMREDPDRYVADMAVMISGLGDGPLLELVAE
jgi:HEAT repeat protein